MASDRMTVQELAAAMGKDYYFVRDELRRDSKRDVRHWPFATSRQCEAGNWSYLIIRTQYEKWANGQVSVGTAINYELLADMIADRVCKRMYAQ